jgi:hypothetical protein
MTVKANLPLGFRITTIKLYGKMEVAIAQNILHLGIKWGQKCSD